MIAFKMLNGTFSAKPLSSWCIRKLSPTQFEKEPLYRAVRTQAIILPDSRSPQRHQNSFSAVVTLSLDFCLADFCFFESSFTSSSLLLLLYRIKMCYPRFNVFSTQKRLLCKFFYIISSTSLSSPFELSQSFS